MFSILTNQTIQVCNQLEKQTYELLELMQELEQITEEVQSLSCMEEPIARLKHQHSEMDSEHTVLKQMLMGLNKIILDYMNCENRICDNGEQNVILYARQEIGNNDFTEISGILNELY